MNGWLVLGILLVVITESIAALSVSAINEYLVRSIISAIVLVVAGGLGAGFFIVNPNEAKVLQLFGNYAGTAKVPGLWWTNPFSWPRLKVSQRVRNFESGQLKVNDHDGNPIEIASVVVWRVEETAEAIFQVDDYENFLAVQSEAALRNLATNYPYDTHVDGELALRRSNVEITDQLRTEIQDRLSRAPAGRSGGSGKDADRRRRGRDGGDGPGGALEEGDRTSGRGT